MVGAYTLRDAQKCLIGWDFVISKGRWLIYSTFVVLNIIKKENFNSVDWAMPFLPLRKSCEKVMKTLLRSFNSVEWAMPLLFVKSDWLIDLNVEKLSSPPSESTVSLICGDWFWCTLIKAQCVIKLLFYFYKKGEKSVSITRGEKKGFQSHGARKKE